MSNRSAGAPIGVDEAVDRIGLGRFQWQLLAICGLTWAADAMEVLLIGFALPGIAAEFGLTPGAGAATLLLTATFAGMFVGALFWGWLADRIGRRTVFLTTVTLSVVFGLLGAFSPNVTVLVLARVLTGFALGGTLPVDYAMMAEFVPTRWRGRFLVWLESFWALGTIAVAALAWWMSSLFPPQQAWRWLLGHGHSGPSTGRRSSSRSRRYRATSSHHGWWTGSAGGRAWPDFCWPAPWASSCS